MYFTMSRQRHTNQAYSINDVLSFWVLQHYTNGVQTSNVSLTLSDAAKAVPLLHPTRTTEGD